MQYFTIIELFRGNVLYNQIFDCNSSPSASFKSFILATLAITLTYTAPHFRVWTVCCQQEVLLPLTCPRQPTTQSGVTTTSPLNTTLSTRSPFLKQMTETLETPRVTSRCDVTWYMTPRYMSMCMKNVVLRLWSGCAGLWHDDWWDRERECWMNLSKLKQYRSNCKCTSFTVGHHWMNCTDSDRIQ